jgi:hypothetical protein
MPTSDSGFVRLLRAEFRQSPFLALSLAINLVGLLIVGIAVVAVPPPGSHRIATVKLETEPSEPLREEVLPDIEEVRPVISPPGMDDVVVKGPVLREEPEGLVFEESLGKRAFLSDGPLAGPVANGAIGLGGGAGGVLGGRAETRHCSSGLDAPTPSSEPRQRSAVAPNTARLVVGADDELKLEDLHASVQVDGYRARVVLDRFYRNDRDRSLEGEFKLTVAGRRLSLLPGLRRAGDGGDGAGAAKRGDDRPHPSRHHGCPVRAARPHRHAA